jgi:hypothetical protein
MRYEFERSHRKSKCYYQVNWLRIFVIKILDKLRTLTCSLDIQMAGLYFWCGNFVVQLGGTEVDDGLFLLSFCGSYVCWIWICTS